MILIHESQQPLLRILWKESPEDPVKTFEMKTVTYGTMSAPFLATRTLLQLSRDEAKNFPLAAPVLRENFYMDDVLCGAASLMEAKALKNQLSGILKKGGMKLHNLKIDWIDELPSERAKEWHRFLQDFNSVSSICIGRCIVYPQATSVELRGFADASEKCYGAVIYCRSQSPDGATVKLVTSKDGVLIVGGRLCNSNLNIECKFPIILPCNHKLTNLIVEYFHLKYVHLGPQALLYQRPKWKFEKDNARVGDLVLIKEDNLAVNKWLMGRLIEVFPGKDNRIRVVMIKTQHGVVKRPISKICILLMRE
ncbi:uncharacterized protein TNCV_105651 [Trichonephila clavipes]|nr:uncharacterized protein TNCV_105651 [Trichonephila clavipes]